MSKRSVRLLLVQNITRRMAAAIALALVLANVNGHIRVTACCGTAHSTCNDRVVIWLAVYTVTRLTVGIPAQ